MNENIENNEIKNDFDAFKERIKNVEFLVDFLDYENIAHQRRLYLNFEELMDNACLLRKLRKEVGEERYEEIRDSYLRHEKPHVMKKQRELLRSRILNLGLQWH